MLVTALYLFIWLYLRAGLLVVKSTIGYTKLNYISFLFPLLSISLGLVALCLVYPQYTFWYVHEAVLSCPLALALALTLALALALALTLSLYI